MQVEVVTYGGQQSYTGCPKIAIGMVFLWIPACAGMTNH
jgi:hypothetical protein